MTADENQSVAVPSHLYDTCIHAVSDAGDLLSSTFYDPGNPDEIKARTELERRDEYITLLETLEKTGLVHPALVHLTKQCLHNLALRRPSAGDVLCVVQMVNTEMESDCCSFSLEVARVRTLKEKRVKERRVRELTCQLVLAM